MRYVIKIQIGEVLMEHNIIKIRERKLKNIINSLQKVGIVQEMDYKNDLDNIQKRIEDNVFRIAVVGEFSSGKSTFINAIIGKDILSHAVDETTAAITRIHNVSYGDPKIDNCKIYYNDGNIKELSDYRMLREYTTVQSGINVAGLIERVDIYINFINTNYPVEIIDTPGLNGVADRHREITLREIKRAHTCIYLLSIKGITKSDIDFLENLMIYQSHFIFIQNFIDVLKTTEGETKEKKIETAEQILKDLFKDKNNITYYICGVSSLFTLVSKDKSLTQVYSGDGETITEEKRKELYEKSGYQDFEKFLSDYINSGRYKETIINASKQALAVLVSSWLCKLRSQQKENEELMNSDSKNEVVKKAKMCIEKIETDFDNNKKKLTNYIVSMDKENQEELKKEMKKYLQNIESEVENKIDEELAEYYDLERILLVSGDDTGKYFSQITLSKINKELIPWMDNCMMANFETVYSDALLRAEQYAGAKVSGYKDNVKEFSVINKGIDDNGKIIDLEKKIRKNENSLEINKKEEYRQKEEYNTNKNKIDSVELDLKQNENHYNNVIKNIDMKIRALGQKPGVEKKRIEKTRVVERTGLFHRLRDFFGSPKTETYYETENDYSKRREWERQKNNFDSELKQKLTEYNKESERLEKKRAEIKLKMENNNFNIEKLKKMQDRLEKEIEYMKEDHELLEKNSKRELLNWQKNTLKKSLRSWLFEDGNSVLKRQNKRIEMESQKHIKDIKGYVIEEFEKSIELRKGNLKLIASNKTLQLEEQYCKYKNDIAELEKASINLGQI